MLDPSLTFTTRAVKLLANSVKKEVGELHKVMAQEVCSLGNQEGNVQEHNGRKKSGSYPTCRYPYCGTPATGADQGRRGECANKSLQSLLETCKALTHALAKARCEVLYQAEACGKRGRKKPPFTTDFTLDEPEERDCLVPGCNVRLEAGKMHGGKVKIQTSGCQFHKSRSVEERENAGHVSERDCQVPGCTVREEDLTQGNLWETECYDSDEDCPVAECEEIRHCPVPGCDVCDAGEVRPKKKVEVYECQAPECYYQHPPHPYPGSEMGRLSPGCQNLQVKPAVSPNGSMQLKLRRPLQGKSMCALERRCCMGAQFAAMLTTEIQRQRDRRNAAEDVVDCYLESSAWMKKPPWPCRHRRGYAKVAR